MSNVPSQILDKTAYGELATSANTPLAQIYAINGLRSDVIPVTEGAGASTEVIDANFVITSGTDPAARSRLVSFYQGSYRAGQGLLARFSAFWEGSAVGASQFAGLLNTNSGWGFGYSDTDFGVVREHRGEEEIQYLSISTPASGAETATVTVDDLVFNVPITSGTAEHNAYEIAAYLSDNSLLYIYSSNGVEVQAVARFSGPAGIFAFTSATATGTWVQQNAGAETIKDFIPQSQWSHPPSWTIDTTKGNVFQIRVQYLGYGGAKFYVMNPATNDFELVHIYTYANKNTQPNVEDPIFRVGWVIRHTGNTTNLVMRGASAAIFSEGPYHFDERSRPLSGTLTGIGTNLVTVFIVRNRTNMGQTVNLSSVIPVSLVLDAEHNKSVYFRIYIGGTYAESPVFQYYDKQNSLLEFSQDTIGYNEDGRLVASFLGGSGGGPINLNGMINQMVPGEIVTVAVQTSSGTGAEVDYSFFWKEDL